jgi:hypothetical protein
MKASLLTAGVLVCTLASLASAQKQVRDEKQRTPEWAAEQKAKLSEARNLAIQQKQLQQAGTQQGSSVTTAAGASVPGTMSVVLPPANDACLSATAISGGGPHNWSNVTATTDGPSNCGIMTKDVWYNWTSGAAGNYRISLCAGTGATIDTVLTVYSGAGCPVGASLACDDDFCVGFGPSKVDFVAAAATTYKIQIGVYNNGAEGSGTFTVLPPPAPPANDLCAAAIAVAGPGPHAFDNTSALTDGPVSCGAMTGDVWFNWTAGATSNYNVSTCGQTALDSQIAVYTSAACVGGLLGCNDQACASNASEVIFPATIGNVYKLQISGWNGSQGSGTFTVTVPPPAPANDLCAAAVAISGPGPHAFTTVGALTDGPSNCGIMTNDVWYNWTAGATGAFVLDMCSGASYDSVASVYDTAACTGTLLDCDDDFCAGFGPSKCVFPTTIGGVYKLQIGGYNGGSGSGTFTVAPAPPPPANDNCATPTTVAGPGPHNFDNSNATTGTQGQTEGACLAFGSTTVENDQWFKWTAAATGQATLTVCGTTSVDTKIAAYPGAPNCPANGTVLACNDDSCGLQSVICWSVTNGQSYIIQLGTFPGAVGGPGTFSISVGAANTPCALDDGVSDNGLGWTAGGEMAWIQSFGTVGNTNVSNIQVAWGSALFPGTSPPNGSPVSVLLYEDPNNDGIPNDITLVQKVNTTVQNVDTDILNPVTVPASVMSGVFFAGASEVHSSGQYPAIMDQTCPNGDRAWFFGDNTAPMQPGHFVNPQTALFPPDSFLNIGFPTYLLVRTCSTSPMVQNCFPGTGGVIACPCGQPANATGGCANFGATATSGARLNATGTPSLAADTLILTTSNHRTAPAAGILNVFFASTGTSIPNGVANGAGVRCYNQTLKRLYTGQTNPPASGSLSKPAMGDPSVSARSAALSSPISAGQTRHYFNLYRDAAATAPAACNNTLSNVNVTNAGSVLWGP